MKFLEGKEILKSSKEKTFFSLEVKTINFNQKYFFLRKLIFTHNQSTRAHNILYVGIHIEYNSKYVSQGTGKRHKTFQLSISRFYLRLGWVWLVGWTVKRLFKLKTVTNNLSNDL